MTNGSSGRWWRYIVAAIFISLLYRRNTAVLSITPATVLTIAGSASRKGRADIVPSIATVQKKGRR